MLRLPRPTHAGAEIRKKYHAYSNSLLGLALGALIDIGLAAATIAKGPKVPAFDGIMAGVIVLVRGIPHFLCVYSPPGCVLPA